MMKKMIYVGLMVMVSVMVFGFGISAAEELVVSDNMIAGIQQEGPLTGQTGEEVGDVLIAKLDIEIYEYDSSLCNQLRKECQDASPSDEPSICDYYTQDNCPNDFPE